MNFFRYFTKQPILASLMYFNISNRKSFHRQNQSDVSPERRGTNIIKLLKAVIYQSS